jgi:hypothetical protein
MMKAEFSRPTISFETINRDFLSSIFKKMNQPILVRSLFVKSGDASRSSVPVDYIDRNFLLVIYRTLNQPISLRPVPAKKPAPCVRNTAAPPL